MNEAFADISQSVASRIGPRLSRPATDDWFYDRCIWQISAGDKLRNHVDICLKWGVVLLGPGDAGPYPQCTEALDRHGWSPHKRARLKRFAEVVQPGDLVMLHVGASDAVGIGEIVGSYSWTEAFGDVDGLDLQHVRRVRWLWQSTSPKRFLRRVFPLHGGVTLHRGSLVLDWMSSLGLQEHTPEPLIELPAEGRPACLGSIADHLHRSGMPNGSVGRVLRTLGAARQKAYWYERSGGASEQETVAQLVMPLLDAFGWSPQKMAVEWNRIDLALFSRLPRSDTNLAVIVEAKRHGAACLMAAAQAQAYALSRPNCRRLVVTDGIRYGVYLRERTSFDLYAYMNLTRLRDSSPIYSCHGTLHALQALTPDGV